MPKRKDSRYTIEYMSGPDSDMERVMLCLDGEPLPNQRELVIDEKHDDATYATVKVVLM